MSVTRINPNYYTINYDKSHALRQHCPDHVTTDYVHFDSKTCHTSL